MNGDELLQYLRENLRIEIDHWGDYCAGGIVVRLKLGDEAISEDKVTTWEE